MKCKPQQSPQLFKYFESVEEQIPDDKRMLLLGSVVDKLDLRALYATYKEGGCPPYDPKALLKAILFAFMNNMYGSRPIARTIKYDSRYKWLAGGYEPSDRTIRRFEAEHLRGTILQVFEQVVRMLMEMGCIDIATVYLDGTTVESRASRHSLVWRNSVSRHAKNNTEKIKLLIAQISGDVDDDLSGIDLGSLPDSLSDADIAKCAQALADRISNNPESMDKEDVRAAKEIATRLDKAQAYNKTLSEMGDRNSMSKNDRDAIGMHPKDDVRKTGPCLAMHNLQIATNSQFVVGFGLFSMSNDMKTLPPMLELLLGGVDPACGAALDCRGLLERVVCDAGYGSIDNLSESTSNGIAPYLKYSGYESPNANEFLLENMPYDPVTDTYKCPQGATLARVSTRRDETHWMKPREVATYQAQHDCSSCPLREKCYRGESPRRSSEVCVEWREIKPYLKELLDSPTGSAYLKKRSQEPEPVFGQMKWDHAYKRFRHFNKNAAIADLAIYFIAHNVAKAFNVLEETGYFGGVFQKTAIRPISLPYDALFFRGAA